MGQLRTEQILVGNEWVAKYEWQSAVAAYQKGIATPEQLEMLEKGYTLVDGNMVPKGGE
jgi:hypothetical protein